MPVLSYPFVTPFPGEIPRPYIPIRITNPANNKCINTYALIDTGADECAFPSIYAKILGHDLVAGEETEVDTGNGVTKAYKHSSIIEMADFSQDQSLSITW